MARTEGDRVTRLPEDAAHGIAAGRSGSEPGRTEAVQTGERLLVDRLDGHGTEIFVAVRLEQSLGVGSVRLVASAVGTDILGRQQDRLVAQLPQRAGPVVGRARGLQQDRC